VSVAFRAMGCDVVVEGAGDDTLASIRRLFEERDATFSRFRRGSELERVNGAPGRLVAASAEFCRALGAALAAARATGGLVEPTLGAALEAAGYDDDFAALRDDGPPAPVPPAVGWRSIAVGARLLERPPGTVLDLNGVVKAMAVDDALDLLDRPGFVSAGGDVAVRGTAVVGLPGGGSVALERGGLATSGTASRRWRRGGLVQHHLIDPATRRPACSPWTFVTAVGSTCLTADVAAKAGFLLGADGPDWLDERGVAARFVVGRTVVCNERWRRSVEPAQAAA
jgi:FAD:protein FMN transferase